MSTSFKGTSGGDGKIEADVLIVNGRDIIQEIDNITGVEGGKVNRTGDTMTGPLVINQNVNGSKLTLSKSLSSDQNNAPTTLDKNSVYLQIGGQEWAQNSYRLIGIGYEHPSQEPPIVIGYQEKNTSGNTFGDFVLATRSSGSAPKLIHLRVTSAGQIVAEQAGYVPSTDLSLVPKNFLTKANVGLGNVDNTTDAAKPISTATQTALNAKLTATTAQFTAKLTAAQMPAQTALAGGATLAEVITAHNNLIAAMKTAGIMAT